MLFQRLEISGFKSFAKHAILEFPDSISAIVGPNGSGKSNIADAIRWVLGEQSMKSLRGKKGEDLIFGGTPQVLRMGKASVSLVFDNGNKIFPYEFDEVIVSRKVYRDGVNEYSLNNSPARLKDIVELLSKVGLGASQHHVIGQGDSDRILYASPKERKSMIEESLGLKIFELKKTEAERKFSQTEENIKHIESLRRELKPHLKYLEEQARKSKNASAVQDELKQLTAEYIAREHATMRDEENFIKKEHSSLTEKISALKAIVNKIENTAGTADTTKTFFEQLSRIEKEYEQVSSARTAIERKLWEMRAKAEQNNEDKDNFIPRARVHAAFDELRVDLEDAGKKGAVDSLRNSVFSITQKVYRLLEEFSGNGMSHAEVGDSKESERYGGERKSLEAKENDLRKARSVLEEQYRKDVDERDKASAQYREHADKLGKLQDAMHSVEQRTAQLEEQKRELELDFGEWIKRHGETLAKNADSFSDKERESMRHSIERLRIRLEEAGGVNENVLREFEETKERDAFLQKELEDLIKAEKQVYGMLTDLEDKIKYDFHEGLSGINKLFGEFFREIFGGGKAEIKLVIPKSIKSDDNEEEIEQEENKPGIEIIVDIPRKRIKSLAMLSGGERALTSIALLFAMATVSPPPFLVLDETDAALDEANSRKYALMLKELSSRTQLIVITHNRETMKISPILYGVTMGGDGVSKLLSVKLEEAEEALVQKK